MRFPNSYGSIVKLGGKRRRPFAVRITTGWTDDGKQIQKYLSYHEKRAEAMAALAEYNQNPFDLDNHKITFAEMYARWVNGKKNGQINKVYHYAFQHLAALHDMPFIDIRRRHIQAVIDSCQHSVSSLSQMKSLCSMVFKYAIDLELVTANQAAGIELPAQVKSDIHQPFTDDEIAALWNHKDDFAAQTALILIYTGLRPSELLTIRTENVFLKEKYMRGGLKTAASKNRIIPLADKILPFIRDMYNKENEFLVMRNGHGLTYSSFKYYWLNSDAKQILTKHRPHDGRHTCATLLSNAEVDLKTIQLILGHRSHNITEHVYTHKSIEQLLVAINKI
jgi:integrase